MDRDERHQFFGVLSVAGAFFVGIVGTVIVQHVIHGDEVFDNDAGANFALSLREHRGCMRARDDHPVCGCLPIPAQPSSEPFRFKVTTAAVCYYGARTRWWAPAAVLSFRQ